MIATSTPATTGPRGPDGAGRGGPIGGEPSGVQSGAGAAWGSPTGTSGAGASGGDHGGCLAIAIYHRHLCRFVQFSSTSAG